MKKIPKLRVEFSPPVIENREEVIALMEHLAKKAGYASAESVLNMDRFKMKKSGETMHAHGFAEISVTQGCPRIFLSLFQMNPSFKSVELTT